MYGKIFDSIYDGTLAEDWRALITFQQFIVLCDADGMVDMTPQSISRRTGIPIEHIKAGIEILEKEDKYSRTLNEDGKRIELIDEHRPWGWHIVNHEKYKGMRDADTIRAQTRERVKRHREKKRHVTQGNGQKPHTDTDTDTDTKDQKILSSKLDTTNILEYLNSKAGRKFKLVAANLNLIKARLNEGHTTEEIKAVIDMKCVEWSKDPKMCNYLRPETLFGAKKFNGYVGVLGTAAPMDAGDEYAYYRKIGQELGINPTSTESDRDYIERVKEKENE
ncbi:MAG: conserved phage C-terminal domain-containing protein [Gammaproteobacteria bacterium]|nr:conserved phage C-terminal domain-containing protein [Gammaproteobacteria bacterium]